MRTADHVRPVVCELSAEVDQLDEMSLIKVVLIGKSEDMFVCVLGCLFACLFQVISLLGLDN